MKNWFIATLASIFLIGTAYAADTGVWYNPERNGDGINLITKDATVVLYYYTYRDDVKLIPPSVSPEPPVVDPIAPNTATWYLGLAHDYDGESASGILYIGEAYSYPEVFDNAVGEAAEVGTFTLLRDGEGWTLKVKYSWNYLVPWYVSLYDVHEFPKALITK